jgi:hypothetical protein
MPTARHSNPTPDPALKGVLNGNCNRVSCQQPNADWYNHSTQRHYCVNCAATLNNVNHYDAMEMFGHALCTPHGKDPKDFESWQRSS